MIQRLNKILLPSQEELSGFSAFLLFVCVQDTLAVTKAIVLEKPVFHQA